MSHLLLFSLGPVQDFIATARRCQDLWFGSWLLSDLARAAATAIQAHTDSTEPLVVPGELTSDTGSVANEVIAIVTTDPALVTAAARDAVSARLADHMARFFKGIPTLAEGGHFLREVAEAQVGDLIETIWAADYGRARKAAKALLASRKATRSWGHPRAAPAPPRQRRRRLARRSARPGRAHPHPVRDPPIREHRGLHPRGSRRPRCRRAWPRCRGRALPALPFATFERRKGFEDRLDQAGDDRRNPKLELIARFRNQFRRVRNDILHGGRDRPSAAPNLREELRRAVDQFETLVKELLP